MISGRKKNSSQMIAPHSRNSSQDLTANHIEKSPQEKTETIKTESLSE